jgi:hypothetical protein
VGAPTTATDRHGDADRGLARGRIETAGIQERRTPIARARLTANASVNDVESFTRQLDTDLNFPILIDRSRQTMETWKTAGFSATDLVHAQGRNGLIP